MRGKENNMHINDNTYGHIQYVQSSGDLFQLANSFLVLGILNIYSFLPRGINHIGWKSVLARFCHHHLIF